LIFVGARENSIMVHDVATPLNPLIAPVEEEELEETLFNVNVSQWPCKEELSKRVVYTQVDHST
jgi:hypothetical protein